MRFAVMCHAAGQDYFRPFLALKIFDDVEQKACYPIFGRLADGTGINNKVIGSFPALSFRPTAGGVVAGDPLAVALIALAAKGIYEVLPRHGDILTLLDADQAAAKDFLETVSNHYGSKKIIVKFWIV